MSHSEITTLYGTNSISVDDERELNSIRPELTKLPSPTEFSKTIQEFLSFQKKDCVFGEEYWKNESPNDETRFQNLMSNAVKAINFLMIASHGKWKRCKLVEMVISLEKHGKTFLILLNPHGVKFKN